MKYFANNRRNLRKQYPYSFLCVCDLFSAFYAKNHCCGTWCTELPPAPQVCLLISLTVMVQTPTILLMDHYNCFLMNIPDLGVLQHRASLHFPIFHATPRVIILK